MNFLSTLNKKAMIAMMIAATGLPASIASAQFRVEHSARDQVKASEKNPERKVSKEAVVVYKVHDDKHEYEVKLVNGKVVYAVHDGHEIDHDRVKINKNVIIFVDEDGKVLHEFKLPSVPNAPKADHASFVWDGQHDLADGDVHFEVKVSPDGDGDRNDFVVLADNSHPKVMLGINLSEPSQALRKHLKLKDGTRAILVERVIEGLPAAKAGLEDFDVIISIDGSDQADGDILGEVLSSKDIGDTLKLVVLRGGDKVKLKVSLEKYDSKSLGAFVTEIDPSNLKADGEFEFNFDDDEFVTREKLDLGRLKEELHQQLLESNEHREIAEVMREKAMEAMRDAERQILELRDGQLFVRSAEEMGERARDFAMRAHERAPGIDPKVLHTHMQEMDRRLGQLESQLNRQIDEMSAQIDRLAVMFERLMNSLDNKDD